jgi:ParB/RepB/Spo0J family partition protein
MKRIKDFDRINDPADYIGQVIRIPTKFVKQLPGQPRTFFDAKQMAHLRNSIEEIGQQQPATVIPWEDGTFRLRDGERRWRSCVQLRIPVIALVMEPKSSEEEFELSTVANMNRESHSPLEKAQAMKRLKDGPLKRSVAEIARAFGVTDQTIYNHLAVVEQLPQAVIDLMDPSKQGDRRKTLQVSAALRLTVLKDHPREQLRIATRIVREELPLSQAVRLVDQFADSKSINVGRGRERKPSDRLQVLKSAIGRISPQVEHFCQQSQRQIDELFEFAPYARHEEIVSQIDAAIDGLTRLRSRIQSVENVGRRGAA